MQEISLHILDIAQNSIRAGAKLIEITVTENLKEDVFSFTVKDDGCGMDEELLKKVTDPFVTTRTTRRVGLGIPLLIAGAEATGGNVKIKSKVGVGTEICATYSHSHIDRQPLGDIASCMMSVISMNPDIDFIYTHFYEQKSFTLETRELKAVLGDVKLSEPSVALWVKEYVNENLTEIYGGAS
ncbi:MAG: ATP-binding protein [Clostridia bacterium]|nr:ATP-binding protein [Clostridia bacterium]